MTIRFYVFMAAALAATPASAHVTLDGKQAAVGAEYKAVFVVPHGCAGSPTIKLRVQIPEGVIATYLASSLKPNTTLYFPVVQECEQGVSRWIEIPPDGATHSHEGKWPAPGVKLTKP